MKIVITGGSGYLGEILYDFFKKDHELVIISRSKPSFTNSYEKWDGKSKGEWANCLNGADVLINLAGKSVNCRYTPENRAEILNSRINATRILNKVVCELDKPPKVWLNSSSATIYQDEYGTANTERNGSIGEGFSVIVCKAWEEEFFNQSINQCRKIALRTAIVMGEKGGVYPVLKNIVKRFKMGRQGSGKQAFSWIHELDFCRACEFLLESNIAGPVNLVSPMFTTNEVLMKRLGQQVNNRISIPCPKLLLKIGAFFMKTETELVLKSRKVYPEILMEEGFEFSYESIDELIKYAE